MRNICTSSMGAGRQRCPTIVVRRRVLSGIGRRSDSHEVGSARSWAIE